MADHLTHVVQETLTSQSASAFVHVGSPQTPTVRYCLDVLGAADTAEAQVALAYDPTAGEWLKRTDSTTLADDLADRGLSGTVLTPPTIPHDAALFLTDAGFDLVSTDVLERARAQTQPEERERIEVAQRAASVGATRGAMLLARADPTTNGLAVEGRPVTRTRLRQAIEEGVVAGGALPDQTTIGGDLESGSPVTIAVTPRTRDGYYGGLTRTIVVASEGGPERRAHVAVRNALQAGRAVLAGGQPTVGTVEAELEAEVRAYGFGEPEAVDVTAAGVGLEPRAPPRAPESAVEPPAVLQLEAAAKPEDSDWVRLSGVVDVTTDGATWLSSVPQSLDPTSLTSVSSHDTSM